MNSSFFNMKDKNGKNVKSLKKIAKCVFSEMDYLHIDFNDSKKCVESLNCCLLKFHENNDVIADIAFSNKHNINNDLKIKKEKMDNKWLISEFNDVLKNIKEFQQCKIVNKNKNSNEINKLINKYKKIRKDEKKILKDKENVKKEIKNILKNKNITDDKINSIINKMEKNF